jgi:NDP-sugar pyrophosphorylase family protein
MLGVVLAAGRGSRLAPLTDDRSKAMMPVAGRCMIERVLEMLQAGGVHRFVVVVHPEDDSLISLLGSARWRDRVQMAHQARREGMAAAVQCAVPLVDGEEFVLASCDNVYPDGHVAALIAHRREQELDAAITLMKVQPEQIPTLAVVVLEGGLVRGIVEKPAVEEAPSDLGVPSLYVLSRRIIDCLGRVPLSLRGEREFPDALRLMIEDGGRVGGRLVADRMTLTRPADLLALCRHYLRSDTASACVEAEGAAESEIVPPVRLELGVKLGPGSRIGPEVFLEAGASVGAGVTLERTVVLRDACVPTGSILRDQVIG